MQNGSEAKHLNFYFDFISPFAYFAWRKIVPFCQENNLQLKTHPVVFGKLLDQWGHKGPAEIPPKREWLAKYCHRYSVLHGFKYVGPKKHPFNPLPALRLSLEEVSGADQFRVISAIFEAGWSHGADIGDVTELTNVLNKAGLDGEQLVNNTQEEQVKLALRKSTEEAIGLGVFGVPTMIIGDELFWGNDQFDYIEMILRGEGILDSKALKQALSRERGIDRKTLN